MNHRSGLVRPRCLRRRWTILAGLVVAIAVAAGCSSGSPTPDVQTPNSRARYDPSRDLGPLFHDVQVSGLFKDSKTFVDARPLLLPAEITARYANTELDLATFVPQYFKDTLGRVQFW